MHFTEATLMQLDGVGERGESVLVRVQNLAGQEFIMSGRLVTDNRRYYGEYSSLTSTKITLDVGQVNRRGDPLLVKIYTEPKDGENRKFFVKQIESSMGMYIWANTGISRINEAIETACLPYKDHYKVEHFSDEAKKMFELIGKPCVICGEERVIPMAICEFNTPRGPERYLHCIASGCDRDFRVSSDPRERNYRRNEDFGGRTICVTPNQVKIDKKAIKRVPLVTGVEVEWFDPIMVDE